MKLIFKYIILLLCFTIYKVEKISAQRPPGFLGKKNVLEYSPSATPFLTSFGHRFSYEKLWTNRYSIGAQFYFHHKDYRTYSSLDTVLSNTSSEEDILLHRGSYSVQYEIWDTSGAYKVVNNRTAKARRYGVCGVFSVYEWFTGHQSPFGVYSSFFIGGGLTQIDIDYMQSDYTFKRMKNMMNITTLDIGFSLGKRNVLKRKMTLGFAFDYRQSFRISNDVKHYFPNGITRAIDTVHSNVRENSEMNLSQISFRMIIGGIF